ncbi:MAG: vWA domain-containing protein [Euryarchaeota archaeon]|nr:vWA domain-containing protein [Euryarchaeota archaeon]
MNKNRLRSTVVTLIVAMVLIGMTFGAMAEPNNVPNAPKERPTASTAETNYPADVVESERAPMSTASSGVTYNRNYPAYAWDGVTYADASLTSDYGYWYDDWYLNYSMPWTFTFFGIDYTEIIIDTNGVITFPPDYNVGYDPYNMRCIAPYWGDLTQWDVDCYIKVRSKTSPNRVVIEWYTDSYSNAAGKNLFEAILYQDGTIRYNYNYLNDPPSPAPSARISDGTTTYYNTYGYETSVTYTPGGDVAGTGTVNINSIDSSSFPYITVYASATDDTGATIGGLTDANFCLKEDLTEETITVTDITSGGGSMADIVFVFDDTGSMSWQIEDLKDTCISFADNLDASGVDYRLGLVTFKDDVTVINGGVLTPDATEFKGWIEDLVAEGGGDWAENSLDALGTATTYTFRPSAQKIFILITDAPPHYAGDGTTYTDRAVAGTITELQVAGAMTFVVGPDRSEYHGSGSISEETGGTWYAITDDFTSIIGAIGDVITHQYVIEYDTHNTAFDGMWRDVLLCLDLDEIDPCSCDISDASGYTAPDSTGITININSIDASGCSDISVYASVTDSEGYSIGGLDEGNFEIYESGSDMLPITVTDIASGGGASTDIVFVFDDTGSMGGQINGLKAKAIDFANSLENSSIDYRLGLVTFKDDVTVINGGVPTDKASVFNAWVDDLYASGGDDWAENSLDALSTATTYSFRPGAQKIFILITDAPPHYAGDGGDSDTVRTVAGTITELQAAGAMTFVVGPDRSEYNGAGSISYETGGRWYSIDSDFSGIIDEIGTVITHQYRIDYTTPDVTDGTTRMVVATVNYVGESASDTSSYTSDCPTGTGLYLHIDGKNCVNLPFVARLTDTVGNPIDGGTIIFNLGGAQFIQTTDADGYTTFTPTVTGTLLAVAQKMGYSTKSVTCEIIDDAELCECIGGGSGCEFGTDPQASDFTITSFNTDKPMYSRGETMVITMTVLNSAGEMYKKLLVDTSSLNLVTGLPLGFVGSWSFVDTGANTYEMRLYIPTSTETGTYNVAGGIYSDYIIEGGTILDTASPVSVTIT